MVTSFDRNFPDKWTHAPSGSSPYLPKSDTVYAGVPWILHVFFKKYARNASGKSDVRFSYKIVRADETLFHDTTGIVAFSGILNSNAGLLLSRNLPVVAFSRKETPGTYRIVVTAEDRIAGTKKTQEKTIVLSKYPTTGQDGFDGISFNVWVHSYCIAPDPGRAIAAFSYFINSKLSNNDEVFWPVFYFFQCLFKDNPFLVEKLVERFPESPARLKEYTVFLLRAIQYQRNGGECPIPDSLWNKFDKVTENGFHDPFAVTFKIGSNRLMEFGFYYYGQYDMIRFLIDCLGLNTRAGYEAFLKNCNEFGVDCVRSLTGETAQQLCSEAGSILKKSYPRHRLVNAYCNYAYEKSDAGTESMKALGEIIASSRKRR
ncbi:MAG: hypothetical protein JW913_00625 [Chitinispirillaceae bacterium]|nr:hypothetical protein [Chitinispirillaceae bacterium]